MLDYNEFRDCLRSANMGFSDELIEYLLVEVDANKDGVRFCCIVCCSSVSLPAPLARPVGEVARPILS